jgi:FkbM family methyltransferase
VSGALRGIARALLPRGVRNALRAPGKTLRRGMHEVRHLAGADPVLELRPGWRVRCHPAAAPFIHQNQVRDAEQAAELDCFIAACAPGMVLFDVGAHYGVFSLAALHYGGAGAHAVALDPSPAAVRMMRAQARLNGADGRMRVVEAAAGDHDGTVRLVAVGILADGFYVRPGEALRSQATDVRQVTLDALAADTGLHPTHVKVDVEGGEAAVLRGARALLTSPNAPVLFLELHNQMIREQGGDPAETPRLLRELGYEARSLHGARVDEHALTTPAIVRVVAERP